MKLATVRPEATNPRASVAMEHAFLCARVASDNKARDVTVLDMRGVSPLYDYFVLATGTSRRQLHAVADEIESTMKAEGEDRYGIEGYEPSRWIVLDYGDIVVHLFDRDARSYYGLEDLWADAKRLDWERHA